MEIATKYGVSIGTVTAIVNQKRYPDRLEHPPNPDAKFRRLTLKKAEQIRREYNESNITYKALATRHHISITTARKIVLGLIWANAMASPCFAETHK